MPTAKLYVCDIKIVTATLAGVIKNARRLTTTVERTILKIAQNLSCWKVFGATFFQKGSKNSWYKLTITNAF